MKEGKTEGKRIWKLKTGPEGQIFIPKEIRDVFGIRAGDELIMNSDEELGVIVLMKETFRSHLDRKNGRHDI